MALRRTIQVGSLALLLSSLLEPVPAHAAAGAAAAEKRHVVGRQDQGTRVTLARDELLVVQLTGRPAAGFSWHLEAVDGTVLTLVGREHDSAPGLGGEDTERLVFKGVAAGASSVTLSYRRAWDALRTGDELFSVVVDVAGPYAGGFTAAAVAAPLAYEATGAHPSHVNLCDPGNGSYSRCTVDTATVTVTVSAAIPAPGNAPPVADAGRAQSVSSGATVTLDGSGSHDPDGSIGRYAWAQTSGSPAITLAGASTAQPTFIAPGGTATLGFTLTVTDDAGATGTATVTVTVGASSPPASGNAPPVADAGAPQVVVQGATVTLDGSRSWDGDGTIASYAWRQTAGPRVQLGDATAAVATFVAPAGPASLAFRLSVTDDAAASSSTSVAVEVTTGKLTVGCSSGGSAAGLGSCALLWPAGLLGRRRRT
jgi:predicted secreted protein